MERIHHTSIRTIRKTGRAYPQELDSKPNGLWYGIGWEWHSWCRSEMPERYDSHKNHFSLELDMKRILLIDTPKKMVAFNKRYSEPPAWMDEPSRYPDGFYIDWKAVARKYAGIEISPYRSDFRRKYSWYYGFDVACGCVWDLKAIKSVKKVINQLKPSMEEALT